VRVCVPKGGEMSYGTVKNRKQKLDGDLMGRSNVNPILDTSIYEVEFDDGSTRLTRPTSLLSTSTHKWMEKATLSTC